MCGEMIAPTQKPLALKSLDMPHTTWTSDGSMISLAASDRHDSNLGNRRNTAPPKGPEFASLMQYKLRLFALSSRICNHTWDLGQSCHDQIENSNAAIAAERQQWDANYLVDGVPSILDTASYANWCILQAYTHQLYLLVHRPFYRSRSNGFRTQSKDMYLESSMSLMDLHRQLCEIPRLRNYRWLAKGIKA